MYIEKKGKEEQFSLDVVNMIMDKYEKNRVFEVVVTMFASDYVRLMMDTHNKIESIFESISKFNVELNKHNEHLILYKGGDRDPSSMTRVIPYRYNREQQIDCEDIRYQGIVR